MTKERIQKLLAQANVASRRASEELITAGRVRVNDVVAKLGDKADPETDAITVDGTRLKFDDQQRTYIALNKPKQILSTTKPHKGDNRQTVGDLIGSREHLFSIGRLDADSEGLVVMTNDGDLAFRLTHPRYRHSKTYRVEVVGLPTAETLTAWQAGIVLEDGKTSACKVEIVKGSVKGTVLRIVMTEGKKRQIRRVAAALGHPVTRLTRTHIGLFALGDLAPGQWRDMTAKEVMLLKTPAPEVKSLRGQVRGQGWRFASENKRHSPKTIRAHQHARRGETRRIAHRSGVRVEADPSEKPRPTRSQAKARLRHARRGETRLTAHQNGVRAELVAPEARRSTRQLPKTQPILARRNAVQPGIARRWQTRRSVRRTDRHERARNGSLRIPNRAQIGGDQAETARPIKDRRKDARSKTRRRRTARAAQETHLTAPQIGHRRQAVQPQQ